METRCSVTESSINRTLESKCPDTQSLHFPRFPVRIISVLFDLPQHTHPPAQIRAHCQQVYRDYDVRGSLRGSIRPWDRRLHYSILSIIRNASPGQHIRIHCASSSSFCVLQTEQGAIVEVLIYGRQQGQQWSSVHVSHLRQPLNTNQLASVDGTPQTRTLRSPPPPLKNNNLLSVFIL